jgi:hypothetical protein
LSKEEASLSDGETPFDEDEEDEEDEESSSVYTSSNGSSNNGSSINGSSSGSSSGLIRDDNSDTNSGPSSPSSGRRNVDCRTFTYLFIQMDLCNGVMDQGSATASDAATKWIVANGGEMGLTAGLTAPFLCPSSFFLLPPSLSAEGSRESGGRGESGNGGSDGGDSGDSGDGLTVTLREWIDARNKDFFGHNNNTNNNNNDDDNVRRRRWWREAPRLFRDVARAVRCERMKE